MNMPGRSATSIAAAALALALALAGCADGRSAAQTPPASGGPVERALTIGAQDIAFDATELRVPANHPFTVVFDNREEVPHNITIDRVANDQPRVFDGEVFSGPATRWYSVPALAPGEYHFFCAIHPAMTGRLVAG